MIRIAYLVTHPSTADHLLRGQLGHLATEGFDVHLVTAPGPQLEAIVEREGIRTHAVPMTREPAPARDLVSLVRLWRLLRRLRPDIVNASTPKAGLLGICAARLAGVKCRIYLLRGLRLDTTHGMRRRVLAFAERWAARWATALYAVSPSLENRYRQLELAGDRKIAILGHGSSNGVDGQRFAPTGREARARPRRRLGLPDGPLVAYFGRLTRDKGISDLVSAFDRIVTPRFPQATLLLVGSREAADPLDHATEERIAQASNIHVRDFAATIEPFYRCADVVAFPSYREGLPNVPLEAAASQVPVVGYSTIGTIDAVVDGETGTLVKLADAEALGEAICAYLRDPDLALRHGRAARERVLRDFDPATLWRAWVGEYRRLAEHPPS